MVSAFAQKSPSTATISSFEQQENMDELTLPRRNGGCQTARGDRV